MKKGIIAAAVFAVVLCAGFLYVKGTPQYSLYQFRKAVQNHDPDTAFKYLDVDSLVDGLASEMMSSPEMNSDSPGAAFGQNLARGLMTVMLPAMKETMKGQIKTAIISPPSESDSKDSKVPVVGLSKGSWSDFDIKVEGKMAVISSKENPDLKFRMVQTKDGYWRISQIIIPKGLK